MVDDRGIVLLVSGASATLHVPFILHSCPFISFLKLWKWLYGLARGPSATNGHR